MSSLILSLIFLACLSTFSNSQEGPTDFNECGISYKTFFTPHVWGGHQAIDGEWPWVVSIQVNGKKDCTGSIIANRYVLSAAHCYFGRASSSGEEADFTVHAGSRYVSGDQVVRVAKVHTYDRYVVSNEEIPNDIAIFELKKPLVFSKNVSKICLAKEFEEDADDTAFIAGFGMTFDKHKFISNIKNGYRGPYKDNYVLNSATVGFQNFKFCNASSTKWNYTEEKYICAGAHMSGTAGGDSGGPLMVKRKIQYGKHPKKRWFEVGVVVGGRHFQRQENNELMNELWSETIYTRVSAYCDWIESTTKNEAKCVKFRG